MSFLCRGRRQPKGETLAGIILLLPLAAPFLMNLQHLKEMGGGAESVESLLTGRAANLLISSLILSTLASLGALLLAGIALILCLSLKDRRFRALFFLGVGWTFCVSPVIHLSVWQMILGGGIPPLMTASWILAWSFFPVPFFLLLLSMACLERSGIECGFLSGDTGGVIRFLVLPRLLPVIAASGVLVFVFSFLQAEVPSLANYPVYPEEFLARIVLEERGAAVALAIPQIAVGLLVVPILFILGRDLLHGGWRGGGLGPLAGRLANSPCRMITAFIFLAALFSPLFILLFRSRFDGFLGRNGEALLTSVSWGIVSALIATMLAHFISDGILSASPRARNLLLGTALLLLLLPGPLFGLGMIELSQVPGLHWLFSGDGLMMFTHTLRVAPLLVVLLEGARRQSRQSEKDDSRLLNVSWIGRQRYLRFPREWHHLVFAGGVGFALILSELSTTILVVSPGTETSVLRLYNLMHYGDWSAVAALAFVQAILAVIVFPLAAVGGWRHDLH